MHALTYGRLVDYHIFSIVDNVRGHRFRISPSRKRPFASRQAAKSAARAQADRQLDLTVPKSRYRMRYRIGSTPGHLGLNCTESRLATGRSSVPQSTVWPKFTPHQAAVERPPTEPKVEGSNPSGCTRFTCPQSPSRPDISGISSNSLPSVRPSDALTELHPISPSCASGSASGMVVLALGPSSLATAAAVSCRLTWA